MKSCSHGDHSAFENIDQVARFLCVLYLKAAKVFRISKGIDDGGVTLLVM